MDTKTNLHGLDRRGTDQAGIHHLCLGGLGQWRKKIGERGSLTAWSPG